MLGRAAAIEAAPRWRSGHPPQATTGVASASSIQASARPASACRSGSPGSISAMAARKSGSVRTRLSQKRRLMSTSSGLASSAAFGARGSSAMPQRGQAPGSERTTSGCIGQVYSAPGGADGSARGPAQRAGSARKRSRRAQPPRRSPVMMRARRYTAPDAASRAARRRPL